MKMAERIQCELAVRNVHRKHIFQLTQRLVDRASLFQEAFNEPHEPWYMTEECAKAIMELDLDMDSPRMPDTAYDLFFNSNLGIKIMTENNEM